MNEKPQGNASTITSVDAPNAARTPSAKEREWEEHTQIGRAHV